MKDSKTIRVDLNEARERNIIRVARGETINVQPQVLYDGSDYLDQQTDFAEKHTSKVAPNRTVTEAITDTLHSMDAGVNSAVNNTLDGLVSVTRNSANFGTALVHAPRRVVGSVIKGESPVKALSDALSQDYLPSSVEIQKSIRDAIKLVPIDEYEKLKEPYYSDKYRFQNKQLNELTSSDSELDNLVNTLRYYRDNPSYLATGGTRELADTGASALMGGTIAKGAGIASKVGGSLVGEALGSYGSAISELNNRGVDIDSGKALATAASIAGVNVATQKVLNTKYSPEEVIDNLLKVSAKNSGKFIQPSKYAGKTLTSIIAEGTEEGLQTAYETGAINLASGERITSGMGRSVGEGVALGSALGGASSLLSSAAKEGNTTTNKNKQLDPNILNPNHKKYDPASALSNVLANTQSPDANVRQQTKAEVSKIFDDANTHFNSLVSEMNIETDETKKAELKDKVTKHYNSYIRPLQATHEAYKNVADTGLNLAEIFSKNQELNAKRLADIKAVSEEYSPYLSNTNESTRTKTNTSQPVRVAIMGDYSKKDTGTGTNDHYDLRLAKVNGKRGDINPYLDRFMVNDKPLSSYTQTGKYTEQRKGYKHEGVDYGFNTSFNQDANARNLYINPQYQVTDIKAFDNNKHGGGWVTQVTFSDGIKVNILHQNKEGAQSVASEFKTGTSTTTDTQTSASNVNTSWSGRKHRDLGFSNKYDSLLQEVYSKYGFTAEEQNILKAQIAQESNFNINAVSSMGAFGLTQFLESTASKYGVRKGDARSQIEGQAKFMKDLLNQFNGDWAKALAAYNTGADNVTKHWGSDGTGKGGGVMTTRWSGGTGETLKYVENILAHANVSGVTGTSSSYQFDDSNSEIDRLNNLLNQWEQEEANATNEAERAKLQEQIDTLKSKLDAITNTEQEQQVVEQEARQAFAVEFNPNLSQEEIDNNPFLSDKEKEEYKQSLGIIQEIESDTASAKEYVDEDNVDEEPEVKVKSNNVIKTLYNVIRRSDIDVEDNSPRINTKALDEAVEANTIPVTVAKNIKRLDAINADMAAMATTSKVFDTLVKGSTDGAKNMMGIETYTQDILGALADNNISLVKSRLGQLDRLATGHESKARAMESVIGESSKENPVYIVKDKRTNEWSRLEGNVNIDEFPKGTILSITPSSQGFLNQVRKEADMLSEFNNNWKGVINELYAGDISSLVSAPKTIKNQLDNINSSQPSSDGSYIDLRDSKYSTSTRTSFTSNTPSTPSVSDEVDSNISFTSVANRHNLTDNQVWVGRGENNKSLSQVTSKEQLNQDGWLGNPYNVNPNREGVYFVGSNEEAAQKYVQLLQTKSNDIDGFVEALQSMKGKQIVSDERGKNNLLGDKNIINSIVQNIPKDTQAAKEFIQGLSVNPQGKLVLPKPPVKLSNDIDKDSAANTDKVYVTTDTLKNPKYNKSSNVIGFRLEGKNKQGHHYTNDERTGAIKYIDKEIGRIQEALDSGKEVIVDAKGIARELRNAAPKTIEHLNKRLKEVLGYDNTVIESNTEDRSSVKSSDVKTYGKAPEPIKATKADTTTETKDTKVEDDIDVIGKKEESNKDKVENVEFNLDDEFDSFIESISDNSREAKLHVSIIESLLNHNPEVKVRFSTTAIKPSYDSKSNTITLAKKGNQNATEQLAMMMVRSTSMDLIDNLDNLDTPEANKLNQELSDILEYLQNQSKSIMPEDPNVLSAFINMVESKQNLLEYGLNDSRLIDYLVQTPYKVENQSTNIFTKLVKAVGNYFGFTNKKNQNIYSKLVELQARAVSLQNHDSNINFDMSKEGTIEALKGEYKQEVSDTEYTKINWFKKGFNQEVSKSKPLTSINNFASKLKADLMQGIELVTKDTPSQKQRHLVNHFLGFRDNIAEHIQSTFVAKDSHQYKDFKTYLTNDEGKLDENTITAIALVIYNHINSEGNSTFNLEKDLKTLLNIDEDADAYFNKEIWETYKHIGSLHTNVSMSLGRNIINVLGLKANDSISEEMASRLNVSLGDWAISSMQSANLVHLHELSSEKHKENIISVGGDSNFDTSEGGVVRFVSFTKTDGTGHNTEVIEEISNTTKGTLGYLDNLFGTKSAKVYPSLNKPKDLITKIKGVNTLVSPTQLIRIKRMQEEPQVIDETMGKVMTELYQSDDTFLLDLIGGRVTDEALAKVHFTNVDRVVSKAEGLKRELNNALDFIYGLPKDDSGKYVNFFSRIFTAKNNRMHYEANMFDMQGSKVARSIGHLKSQEATLDLGNFFGRATDYLDSDGKANGMGNFIKALSENLEGLEKLVEHEFKTNEDLINLGYIRGFTTDKVKDKHFIPVFSRVLENNETIQEAIPALLKMIDNPKGLTADDKTAIKAAVDLGGMGASSLRALIEYAKFKQALNNQDKSFTTGLAIGSDGINNGSAIATMLLGLMTDNNLMARFGVIAKDFVEVLGYKDFSDTRTNSAISDYYTAFKPALQIAKDDYIARLEAKDAELADSFRKKYETMTDLSPSFSSRAVLKAILIPFGYNAGMDRLIQIGAFTGIDDIKTKMMKLYNAKVELDAEAERTKMGAKEYGLKLKNLKDEAINLNTLLKDFAGVSLVDDKGNIDIDGFRDKWFNSKELSQLNKAYTDVFGKVLKLALNDYAGDMIEQRKAIVNQHNIMSNIYIKLRDKAIQEALDNKKASIKEQLRKSNPSLSDGDINKKAETTLNTIGLTQKEIQAIQDKLAKYEPRIPTSMDYTGDTRPYNSKTGISLLGTTNKVKGANRTVNAATQVVDDEGNYIRQYKSLGERIKQIVDIGVFGFSASIQGVDATTAARATTEDSIVSLNVHDALIGNIDKIVELARTQNRVFYETIRDYDMNTVNIANMVTGIIDVLSEFKDDTDISQEVRDSIIKDTLAGINVEVDLTNIDSLSAFDTLKEALLEEVNKATSHDIRKLKQLDDYQYFNQYGFEGSSYEPTDADKAIEKANIERVLKQREALENEINKAFSNLGQLGKRKAQKESKVPKNDLGITKIIGFNLKTLTGSLNDFKGTGRINSTNYKSDDVVYYDSTSRNETIATLIEAKEISLAIKAGASIIMPFKTDRAVPKSVAGMLLKNGYMVEGISADKKYYRLSKVHEPAYLADKSDNLVLHSGGALGADTDWHLTADRFGLDKYNHYMAQSYVGSVSKDLKNRKIKATPIKDELIQDTILTMNLLTGTRLSTTDETGKLDYISALKARNMFQVFNSKSVYAVVTQSFDDGVAGGTNGAVQLGIIMGKPVYVYDVSKEQWYSYDNKGKTAIDLPPTIEGHFAGVGTRDIAKETKDLRPRAIEAMSSVLTDAKDVKPKVSENTSKLPNKTESGNVIVNAYGGFYISAYEFLNNNPKGIVAYRKEGMNNLESNFINHRWLGNPFNWKDEGIGEVKATDLFLDWLLTGNNHGNSLATDSYRNAILSRIPDMKGQPILYYKELGRASHANAIDYVVNGQVEKTKPTNESVPVINTVKVKPDITEDYIVNTSSLVSSLTKSLNSKSLGFSKPKDSQDRENQTSRYKKYRFMSNMLGNTLDMIKQVNPNVTIKVMPIKDIEAITSVDAKGQYDSSTNTIYLSKEMVGSDKPLNTSSYVVHEMFHALTEKNMNPEFINALRQSDKPSDKRIVNAYDELDKIREQALNANDTNKFSKDIVFYDVGEMISYMYSNPMVMDWVLNNVSTKVKGAAGDSKLQAIKGFLNNILDKVSTILGLNREAKANLHNINKLVAEVMMDSSIKDTLPTTTHIRRADQGIEDEVNEKSFKDILKGLDNKQSSPEHDAHLDSVIDKIIDRAYELNKDYKATVDKSKGSLQSQAITHGFKLTDKESHAYEAVYALLDSYVSDMPSRETYQELVRMFYNIRNKVDYKAFLPNVSKPTKDEVALAKRMYSFIFGGNKKDLDKYLNRFVGLSITSEDFKNTIDGIKLNEATKPEKWFDRVMYYLNQAINWLTKKAFDTKGKTNSEALYTLMDKLNLIDYRARNNYASKLDTAYRKIGIITTPLNKVTKAVTSKGIDILTNTLGDTEAKNINKASKIVKDTNLMEQVIDIADGITGHNNPSSKGSEALELLREASAYSSARTLMERLLRITQVAGKTRESFKTATSTLLHGLFEGVDKDSRDSITRVLLRTDASSLLNYYNKNKALNIIFNAEARKEEIAKLEKTIESKMEGYTGNGAIIHTKKLAWYMVRETSPENLIKNPVAIASYYHDSMDNVPKGLIDELDALTSLYALEYTSGDDVANVNNVNTTHADAIYSMLKLHNNIAKDSKEEFKDNPYSYVKGFAPQITNPLRSLHYADNNEQVDKMMSEGWVLASDGIMDKDDMDKSEGRVLMYHEDIHYQNYNSGALDKKDTHAKGFILYHAATDGKDIIDVTKHYSKKHEDISKNVHHSIYDPSLESNSLVAAYSTDGSIINYHYEMTGFIRDKLLERNNDFIEVLSTMNSNVKYKPLLNTQQKAIARAIHEDYSKGYKANPALYMVIDPKSKDPKIQEMYRTLPFNFRQEAAMLFGKGQPIVVRRSLYTMTFGYKQLTLSSIFDLASGEGNTLAKIFAPLVYGLVLGNIGGDAKTKVIKLERINEMLVRKAKDFIVIRNPKVLIGNIIANTLLLLLHGVTPLGITQGYTKAWKQGKEYNDLYSKLQSLKVELQTGRGNVKKLQGEINSLEHRLNNHPMHEYMVNGIMSSIVEDVEARSKNDYATSKFEEKLNANWDNLPKGVKTVAETYLMSPDTKLHAAMSDATQFSDFSAKVVLIEYYKSKGVSFDEAVKYAQESFINYDIPTGPKTDYANRMGALMFTKFLLRFQPILNRMMKEKPASTVLQHMAVEGMGYTGVLDPYIFLRLGNNPLQSGAFTLLDSYNETLVGQMVDMVLPDVL